MPPSAASTSRRTVRRSRLRRDRRAMRPGVRHLGDPRPFRWPAAEALDRSSRNAMVTGRQPPCRHAAGFSPWRCADRRRRRWRQSEVIVPLSGGRHAHWPAWSRDGAFIYFVCTAMTTQAEPTELCRVPFKGGPVEPVVTTERRAMNAAPAPDGSVLFSANPKSLDAGLWWRPKNGGDAIPLTGGIGEYSRYLFVQGRKPRCCYVVGRPAIAGRDPHSKRRRDRVHVE